MSRLHFLTRTEKDPQLQNEEGQAQRPKCRTKDQGAEHKNQDGNAFWAKTTVCKRAKCNSRITAHAWKNLVIPLYCL